MVGALVLSACSTEGDGGPAPSVISPDALVSCEDRGDCGEAGAVRWSVPLEGDYRMSRSPDQASALVTPEQWMDSDRPDPGAVVRDGVLHHHRDHRVTALDADTGAELWAEEFDGLVTSVTTSGETTVVRTRDPAEDGGRVHLLRPEGDGVEHVGTEVPDELLNLRRLTNDTHVALSGRPHGAAPEEDRDLFLLVDAATGDVEWSHEAAGSLLNENLAADNALYVSVPADTEDGPSGIARVVDGREDLVFDRPEELREGYRFQVTETGELLINTDWCKGSALGCNSRGITALEAETGRTLWNRDDTGSIASLTTDGTTTHLHIVESGGYRTVDARTGEVVAEGAEAAGETEALLRAFSGEPASPANTLPPELTEEDPDEDGEARLQEALDLIPTELRGPGMERTVVLDGLAAGARHLTTHLDGDGRVVGVFSGCAPDGVRPPSWDSGSPEAACAEPRLFAVDFGI